MNKRFLSILAMATAGIAIVGCSSEQGQTTAADSEAIITLGEYKGVSTGVALHEITEEDIEAVINDTVSSSGGYFEDAGENAAAEEGYQLTIEYSETSSPTETYPGSIIIGDSDWPEEFSTALVGLKIGDETTVTLSEDDGGATYNIKVISVNKPAQITDEYVKTLGIEGVSSVEDLREDVTAYLEEQYRYEYEEEVKDAAGNKVYSTSTVTNIPQKLIDEYTDLLNTRIEAVIESQSTEEEPLTKSDILQESMAADEFVGTVDEYIVWYAEKNAKEYLIYQKIAEDEGITIDNDELYSMIASEWVSEQDTYPTLLEFMDHYGREQYERAMLTDKVKEFIAHNAIDYMPEIKEATEKSLDTTENASADNSADSSNESSMENGHNAEQSSTDSSEK